MKNGQVQPTVGNSVWMRRRRMGHDDHSRVRKIFQSAIDILPENRSDFLEKESRGDVEVKRKVERLLDSYEEDLAVRTATSHRENSIADNDLLQSPTKIISNPDNASARTELATGSRLNRYQILSKIGSGGMGDVYLAQDATLRRKVALKLLAVELTGDLDSLKRFEHEAHAVSALNHPNIVTIFEFGRSEKGEHFIATEYVEGKTLDDFCRTKGTKLRKKLDIAIQIASALNAAHESGIIHRDIKPENIIVRPDGFIKVLDFGLAKLSKKRGVDEVDTDARTRSVIRTSSGVVMGTTPYMSPEQIRGQQVDNRTDIWSLGVVIYQMVSGKLPFQADSAGDTIAEILRGIPPTLSKIVRDCPAELEQIVTRAIQKDRENRYRDVMEFLYDLKTLRNNVKLISPQNNRDTDPSPSIVQTKSEIDTTKRESIAVTKEQTSESRLHSYRWLGWGTFAAILAIMMVAGYFYRPGASNMSGTNLDSSWVVSEVDSWNGGLGESPTIRARFSPNGNLVAYTSTKDGLPSIWLKQLTKEAVPFSSKDMESRDRSPIFSPDGQQIAFLSIWNNKPGIWSAPALRGTRSLLGELESLSTFLVRWSNDEKSIFFEMKGNLHVLDISTAQTRQLTKLDSRKPGQRSFAVSADGKRIAYVDERDGQNDIWTIALNGDEAQRLTNNPEPESNLVWHPDNRRIIFNATTEAGKNQIFEVSLDRGVPVSLIPEWNGREVSDISSDGKKILLTSTNSKADLWTVRLNDDASDHINHVTNDPGLELSPEISPDGKSIVYQAIPGSNAQRQAYMEESHIYTRQIAGETQAREIAKRGFLPRWSPNGDRIAFIISGNNKSNLWISSASGSEKKALTKGGVTLGEHEIFPYSRVRSHEFHWSTDGTSIYYCARREGVSNVWVVKADGSGNVRLSQNTNPNRWYFTPFPKPDGRRIAVLVMTLPSKSKKKFTWEVKLLENNRMTPLFESDSIVSILGWSADGRDILVKSLRNANNTGLIRMPSNVDLIRINGNDGSSKRLHTFENTYFSHVSFSPKKKSVAYVNREGSFDYLRSYRIEDGTIRNLLKSEDENVFFTGLAWSNDESTISIGKQANEKIISMVENLK